MKSINGVNFVTSLRSEVNKYFTKKNISKHANVNMYIKCILMLLIYIIPYVLMISGIVDKSLFWLLWLIINGVTLPGIPGATPSSQV